MVRSILCFITMLHHQIERIFEQGREQALSWGGAWASRCLVIKGSLSLPPAG